MSLDNLSATQTVRAPNAQTLSSLPVPGTGRLPCTSPVKAEMAVKSRQQEEEEGGREGRKAEQLHGDCASYSSLDSVRVETSIV